MDKRKNKDLEKFKCMGRPFTPSSQVDEYLKSDDSNKVVRLYIEVRYARDTSVSMPKNSNIFRLMRIAEDLVNKHTVCYQSLAIPGQCSFFQLVT